MSLDTDAIAQRLAARLSMRGQHNDGDEDIAALLAEVATLQKNYQLLMESHQGMANENLRLGGIIQTLREALQPLAEQDCESWGCEFPRSTHSCAPIRARRVLEGET